MASPSLMTSPPRPSRWPRLALMALAVSLAVAGLTLRPSPPDAPRPRLLTAVPSSPVRPVVARATAPASAEVARPVLSEEPVPERVGEAAPVSARRDEPGPEPATGGDEPAGPGPDVIVALGEPAPGPPVPRPPTFVHTTDSAQPVPAQPPGEVDAVAGTSESIPGLEPGQRYWFGPRGLEKLPVSTEGQQ